jgi:AcrR family transcriptional regulator
MDTLLGNLKIKIPHELYLKDPSSSSLGKTVLREGLRLMQESGFESFTFKKLADNIGSPESSLYRYFENKHKLLAYLMSFYWCWQEYRVTFTVMNVADAGSKLVRAIEVINLIPDKADALDDLNLHALFHLAEQESVRIFLHHHTNDHEKTALFEGYRRLTSRLCRLVTEVDPTYPFPQALITTLLDAIHLQPFYARDIAGLTDVPQDSRVQNEFFTRLVLSNLRHG